MAICPLHAVAYRRRMAREMTGIRVLRFGIGLAERATRAGTEAARVTER